MANEDDISIDGVQFENIVEKTQELELGLPLEQNEALRNQGPNHFMNGELMDNSSETIEEGDVVHEES